MGDNINPKIFGAIVVGLALVAGAYTTSNFGESRFANQNNAQSANVQGSADLPRVSIAVYDKDENGIEDWRDAFVTTEIDILSAPSASYTAPTTLTGQTGVRLLEGIINHKLYAPLAPEPDKIAADTVSLFHKVAESRLFGTKDLVIMEEWNDEDVRNYANTLAGVMYNNSVPNMESELVVINDILKNEKFERIAELEVLRDVYLRYRDESLTIPVPKEFAKVHLDLLNTYQAIYEDIDGMTKIEEDPLLALIYIKRYDSDIEGLSLALKNMFDVLATQADVFGPEDPALLFATFSPDYKPNN